MATANRIAKFWNRPTETAAQASPIVSPMMDEILARDMTIARMQKRLDETLKANDRLWRRLGDDANWYETRLIWLASAWIVTAAVTVWLAVRSWRQRTSEATEVSEDANLFQGR